MNSSETFNPENQTISQIFNSERIYRVPNYQRQYAWQDKHLNDLWEDLWDAFCNKSEENDCYFLGSIVVVDKKGTIYSDIIDGQQRITTLMILLNVIAKNFNEINSNVEKISETPVVTSAIVNNRIKNENGRDKLQLQTYKDYNAVFINCIKDCNDFSCIKKPTDKELKLNEPRFKYINTACFFFEKLNELKQNDEKQNKNILGEFVNYIFYNVNIIKIVCTNESFAIKLFQVMNDRGMQLSSSDIIKSYLLTKYNNDEQGIQNFESAWAKIENSAKDNNYTVDDFMVYFEYFKLKSNPKRQLTDEMKDIIESNKVDDLVNEMSNFSDSIKNVYKLKNAKIYSLRYLPWKFYIITLLASAEYVKYKDFQRLLEILQRFYYLALISGKNLNQIKQISFTILGYIIANKDIQDIYLAMEKVINEKHFIMDTYIALEDDMVYGEKWLKPLLMSLDYELKKDEKIDFIEIDKSITIDHILPQKFDKEDEWDYIDVENGNLYMHTLGNLALLSEIKNKEALNRGFDKKIKIYQGINPDTDEKESGYTVFETTINIINEYGKNKKKWNIDTIESRKEYLIGLVEKLLNISKEQVNKEEINNTKLLGMKELIDLEYINIGDKLYISLDKDNSIATLIDYKHVDFKGKIMTLNEWGCLITGWKSIRIYQYCCKVGEEETLQQKRIKYIKEIANNIEE